MGTYPAGTAVTITETFRVAGVPTDPTTVVFTLEDPTGVQTTYTVGDPEVSNPSVGVYELEIGALITSGLPGKWLYSCSGTGAVEATAYGDFTVLQSPLDPIAVPFAQDGPCTPWCDPSDIWVSCGSPTTTIGEGSMEDECAVDMTPYATMASWLLWMLSMRQYSGICERTVRPCGTQACGFQILAGSNHIVWPTSDGLPPIGWNGWNWGYRDCGCVPLDRIRLAGYPVREVIEVKIDGVVVPETDNWRLDDRRFLTRIADANGNPQRWPSCQRLDMDDTEAGTFSVTYAYGKDPPLLGQLAAAKVGCELYNGAVGGECSLPSGTVRITRQGVTIDKMATLGWFFSGKTGNGWQTGLGIVDAFLNASNPAGLTRRPVMMAPGQRSGRFAQSMGT